VLSEFEQFISEQAEWFRGLNPESSAALAGAEQQLGLNFPVTLKWLLTQYGYWRATGVGGLPFIVGATQAYRPHFPDHWIVLARSAALPEHDAPCAVTAHQQMGLTILIVSPDAPLDGRAVLQCSPRGDILRKFSGYSDYVRALQQHLEAIARSEYRVCLPSFHRGATSLLMVSPLSFDVAEFQLRVYETILASRLPTEPSVMTEPLLPETETETESVLAGKFPQIYVPQKGIADSALPQPATAHSGRSAERSGCKGTLEPDQQPLSLRSQSAGSPGPWDEFSETLLTASETGPLTAIPRVSPAMLGSNQSWEHVLIEMIRDRRERLEQRSAELPQSCFIASSSPERGYCLPETLPEGQLLLTPVELLAELEEIGFPREQHVCLLQWQEQDGPQDWALSWVADSQLAAVNVGWFRRTGSTPCWIVSAGESLSEIAPRLQRIARIEASKG